MTNGINWGKKKRFSFLQLVVIEGGRCVDELARTYPGGINNGSQTAGGDLKNLGSGFVEKTTKSEEGGGGTLGQAEE